MAAGLLDLLLVVRTVISTRTLRPPAASMNFECTVVPIDENWQIEGFCKAVASVCQERIYLTTFDGFTLDESRSFVQYNKSKGLPNLVALHDGKVIGWCDVSSSDRPVLKHTGVVGMGIIKDFRDKGIGTMLLSKAISAAKEAGLTRIELSVREENVRAIALYKKLGFEVEGVQRRAALVDGVYSNHVMMAQLFDP